MSAFVSRAGYCRAGLLGATLLFGLSAHAQDNLHFHGALTASPCILAPESERAEVNLGSINMNADTPDEARTPGKEFTLRLEQCDTSLAKTATIDFTTTDGNGHWNYGRLTPLTPEGVYPGVDIGIETVEGKPVLVDGGPDPVQVIVDGGNQLRFRAYAIKWGTITPGSFTAVANFRISYE